MSTVFKTYKLFIRPVKYIEDKTKSINTNSPTDLRNDRPEEERKVPPSGAIAQDTTGGLVQGKDRFDFLGAVTLRCPSCKRELIVYLDNDGQYSLDYIVCGNCMVAIDFEKDQEARKLNSIDVKSDANGKVKVEEILEHLLSKNATFFIEDIYSDPDVVPIFDSRGDISSQASIEVDIPKLLPHKIIPLKCNICGRENFYDSDSVRELFQQGEFGHRDRKIVQDIYEDGCYDGYSDSLITEIKCGTCGLSFDISIDEVTGQKAENSNSEERLV